MSSSFKEINKDNILWSPLVLASQWASSSLCEFSDEAWRPTNARNRRRLPQRYVRSLDRSRTEEEGKPGR